MQIHKSNHTQKHSQCNTKHCKMKEAVRLAISSAHLCQCRGARFTNCVLESELKRARVEAHFLSNTSYSLGICSTHSL